MFGMLDYRAHKLFWLLCLPIRLAWRAFYFIFIAIAVSIGIWTGYPPLGQMIVAYVAFEGMFLVFGLLWLVLITWPVDKFFFWVVDVMPARGEDTEEAKEIADSPGACGNWCSRRHWLKPMLPDFCWQ